MPAPLDLAVLVSGSGTTLQNLIDRIAGGTLAARVRLVVGSRAGLVGVQRAEAAGIPTAVVDRRQFADCASFSNDVFAQVDRAGGGGVGLVCMAGWLCLLDVPPRYAGKTMNIHPALLPSPFGGRGMFGKRVHEAVLAHGCKVSGCTVHFVDSAYDNGPIIVQRTCVVAEDDTPATLAARVFEEEKIAYTEAIRLFAEGRLAIEGRRVHISSSREASHRASEATSSPPGSMKHGA